MKKIFKFDEFVNERAVPMDDLVKGDTALLVSTKKVFGLPHINMVLQNPDKAIIGFVEMEKLAHDDKAFKIERSAAEKDYGPDIYDMALMTVYPEGVRPSWEIKPAAQKVWKYYLENRPDVKKVEIKEDSSEYIDHYEKDKESEEEHDPATLKMINTIYYLEPSEDYKKLVDIGEEIMKKEKINVAEAGTKYFYKKYGSRNK
jgi:hypothetical protein